MNKIYQILILSSLFVIAIANHIEAQVGNFTFTGDLALTSSTVYEAEIKDLSGAGLGNDLITITNNASLDGTLDIILDGYSPQINDMFEILSYGGTLSGSFSNINWPSDMISQGWDIDYGIIYPGKVVIYVPSLLPVELLSFNVVSHDRSHLLNWETSSEINNAYFSVELSLDGYDFMTIGKVDSKGNSSVNQSYNFLHTPTETGTCYYRLKQVDENGAFEYSSIVSIVNNLNANISFFPNPVRQNITFDKAVSDLVIYNVKGQEVFSSTIKSEIFDLSDLANGVYIIKTNETSVLSQRLVINK